MKVFRRWPDSRLTPCALTIGTFDGVHRGHQMLTETLKIHARERTLPAMALTFDDMPYCYFRPDDCPRLLSLPDEKIAAFKALGLDRLAVVPFDKTLAQQSAAEFARHILIEKLNVRLLVVGPDFALGKGRGGDVQILRALGEELGFEVVVLDEKLLYAEVPISSTRARGCVEEGHMKTASDLLGRTFSMAGSVVSGQQLGRKIGVPTINLQINSRKVLPANGVYACRATLENQSTDQSNLEPTFHRAALNIGHRPTVNGTSLSIEFHVIDEEILIAPTHARLEIVERLRDEKKFDGLNELVSQMRRDIGRAREILQ